MFLIVSGCDGAIVGEPLVFKGGKAEDDDDTVIVDADDVEESVAVIRMIDCCVPRFRNT